MKEFIGVEHQSGCRIIQVFGVDQQLLHRLIAGIFFITKCFAITDEYAKYQDPATGRWFQIVDKPLTDGNWLETSSSSMYDYTVSKAVERRYISKSFFSTACKGYKGVLTQLSLDANGEAHIANICDGTNVGDLNYYLQRQRKTDDFHGLGAFLIMNEQMRGAGCAGEDGKPRTR